MDTMYSDSSSENDILLFPAATVEMSNGEEFLFRLIQKQK